MSSLAEDFEYVVRHVDSGENSAVYLNSETTQALSQPAKVDVFVSKMGDLFQEARLNDQVTRQYKPKRLNTLLSTKDLEAHGLCIFKDSAAQDWIIRLDSDNLVDAPKSHGWFADFKERIDELRLIAEEEGLPFSDASAESARKFAMQVTAASRPSIFLIGNGNVRLLWTYGSEQIGLQFLGDSGGIQYVMLALRNGKVATHMGSDDPATVLRLVSALGLRHLFN